MRDGDTVKHYRIRQLDEGGFFISRRTTFRTLQELVEHYSADADGLCVNLRKPCIQVIENDSFKASVIWTSIFPDRETGDGWHVVQYSRPMGDW